jgi:hypothetical protein
VPEWATAVLSAAVATLVSLAVTALSSYLTVRHRAKAQWKLARRKLDRVLRRDVALIDEYFNNGRHSDALSRLRDCGAEVDELVVFAEELRPDLSEALAEYRDRLARFKRDPYMVFGEDPDPKVLAQPVVEAANVALTIAGLPKVGLAPYQLPEQGRG